MNKSIWNGPWPAVFLISFCILAGLLILFGMARSVSQEAYNKAKQAEELKELTTRFNNKIELAKSATADPCANVFFEFVMPPNGLDEKPKLIMMGQEVSYSLLDSSMYFLLSKDDKIELWKRGILLGQTRFSQKIGEKYSPDSQFCQEKAKLELE